MGPDSLWKYGEDYFSGAFQVFYACDSKSMWEQGPHQNFFERQDVQI